MCLSKDSDGSLFLFYKYRQIRVGKHSCEKEMGKRMKGNRYEEAVSQPAPEPYCEMIRLKYVHGK